MRRYGALALAALGLGCEGAATTDSLLPPGVADTAVAADDSTVALTDDVAAPGSEVGTQVTPAEYHAGPYQLTVVAVDDGCVDGALALLFMPNGDGAPYQLKNPTTLPALTALPAAGEIVLEAPFQPMPVTWEAGDAGLAIRAGAVPDVLLTVPGSKDCRGDLTIDADLALDAMPLTVTASVRVSNLESPTQTCPDLPEGCLVGLTLSAEPL